jgi:hypothetical protein
MDTKATNCRGLSSCKLVAKEEPKREQKVADICQIGCFLHFLLPFDLTIFAVFKIYGLRHKDQLQLEYDRGQFITSTHTEDAALHRNGDTCTFLKPRFIVPTKSVITTESATAAW